MVSAWALDVVETVMACEHAFKIQLEDWRLESVSAVGDLFELISGQPGLPEGDEQPQSSVRNFLPMIGAPREGWSRDTVWAKLVRVISDQLQVEPDEVRYTAHFENDLGAD